MWGALAAAVLSAWSIADPPVSDGISLGGGLLRPSISLMGGYDSAAVNVFDTTMFVSSARGDVFAGPATGLAFDLDTSKSRVSFHGELGYRYYAGLLEPTSTSVSWLWFNTRLELAHNRDGVVEPRLLVLARRVDWTTNVSTTTPAISTYAAAEAALALHLGRRFELVPRFRVDFERLSSLVTLVGDQELEWLSYVGFEPELVAKAYLARDRALVLDAAFIGRKYLGYVPYDPFGGARSSGDTSMVRAAVGYSGVVRSRLTARAMVGVAADLGAGKVSPILQAELGYSGEVITVRAGAWRALLPVPAFSTMDQNRGYLELQTVIAESVALEARAAVDLVTSPYTPSSTETIFLGRLGLRWQVNDNFVAGLSYQLAIRTQLLRHEPMATFTFAWGRTVPRWLPASDPTEPQASTELMAPRRPGGTSF